MKHRCVFLSLLGLSGLSPRFGRSLIWCSVVTDKIRVNLHHGKIEDAVVRAVIQDGDGIKLQVDVVGLERKAKVDSAWVDCQTVASSSTEVACTRPVTPLVLILKLLSESMAQRLNFQDDAF